MNAYRMTASCAVVSLALLCWVPAAHADSSNRVYGALKYRAIGPAIAGGRVTAAAGSDRDAQLYYVGGADGGVFKSTNAGASWHPVFDAEPVAAIGAIAVDGRDPNIVWVGTGEANPRNDASAGGGLWWSGDGARSWKRVGLEDAGSISSISIDPRASGTVVVGALGQEFRDNATRGIYRTIDNGAHWQRTLFIGPSTGVSDIVRSPARPSTLFAGLWDFRRRPWTMISGGASGGIYRSDDGGAAWRKLVGHGLPSGVNGRIGLAASGNYLYARIQSKQGFIWRSTDGGTQWQRMPASPFVGARGFYFSRVFADPNDPQRLLNLEGVASMSTNGARSFKQTVLSAGYDFHFAWWSHDGKRIILATDEGVIISHDGGANWVQPYDLPFAQVYHVGLDGVVPYYHVCIGLQDVDSWCAPQSVPNGIGVLNRDWSTIAPGDGMWSIFDPLDQNLLWSSETNTSSGQIFVTNFRTGQQTFVSPSARLTFGVPANAQRYRFNWDAPIAFTSTGTALVGGNVLFASGDRGQTWKVISPDLTRDDKAKQGPSGGPVQLDMSDAEAYDTIMYIATTPRDPDVIWVGTDDGLVQLTRDGGAHWHDVTPKGIPAWARVMGMDVSAASAGTVYVAADGHMLGDDRPYLFVSDDFGATWRSISGGLPADLFVRSIRQDPKNPQVLYAGTRRGVWVSFDGGLRWNDLRLNMPASAVYDLEIQPDQNDLVVGTHGRGVWILDDLSPLQHLSDVRQAPLSLFPSRAAYRMFAASPVNTSLYNPQTPVADNIFVGENAPSGAIIDYYLKKPAHQAPSIQIADASGRVVRHLSGSHVTNRAGINRVVWNLAEDGPVLWKSSINKSIEPHDGAEALPGAYVVTLRADGQDVHAALIVKQDPRDPSSFAQYQQRHDILAQLTSELSGVDSMLNAIDAQHPLPASFAALKRQLTNAPAFDEDNISRLPGLRERLLDLLSQFSTSFQAPTASQLEEAAALKLQYDELSGAFKKLQ